VLAADEGSGEFKCIRISGSGAFVRVGDVHDVYRVDEGAIVILLCAAYVYWLQVTVRIAGAHAHTYIPS